MSFAVAAEAYDAFMGRWSRRLAVPFADFAAADPPARLLDVGCGTGALSEELRRRRLDARLVAVDPSTSFAASVSGRLSGIGIAIAAAEQLPFPDAVFDAALAQLVVHFMADPVLGLAEMRRVTRPGGMVGACVWDYGGERGPLGVFWESARAVDPDAPGESHLPGTSEGQLEHLLRAAGLREVEAAELIVAIEHPTFEDWWAPFTRGAGPAGSYVASLDQDGRERVMAECRRRLPMRPIVVNAVAWAARGSV